MSGWRDHGSVAETRRMHEEMRSPLSRGGDADLGVDNADELRDLWADLVADTAPVEPAVPPAPAWPAVAPRVRTDATGAPDLIVLPADDRVGVVEPPRAPLGVPPVEAPPVAAPLTSPTAPVPPVIEPEPSAAPTTHAAPPPVGRRERRAAARLAKDERRGTRLELRRHRVLPRTVIGISLLLLVGAVGAAFSGALLYAYYDWRLSTNEDRVGVLAESLQERLTDAGTSIDEAQQEALAELQARAGPLIDQKSDAVAMADLTPVVTPSTFFLSTLDEDGRPSVGTAFVVASEDARTLLLTSYRAVQASTTSPGPEIRLTDNGGGDALSARLYSWDPEHDLALLVVEQGGFEPLNWATGDDAAVTGKPVYAASGIGAAGVTFSPGTVLDQSADGIQMTAPVGSAWQGAPIVNQDGQVVAVASLAYEPLGFNPGQVPFAPPVGAACDELLDCGAGSPQAVPAG